jgi:hypothetical protein
MGLATLVGFMFKEYSRQRYNRWIILLPVVTLTVGVVLTYHLTATYQMQVAKAWYLTSHYPPEEMQALLNWLARSGFSYFDMAMGGWQIGCFAILLLSVYMFTSVVRAPRWGTEQYLFVVLLVLVSGSIMADVLGVYPFGGIRQHLFAAPLIVLCTAQAVVSLGAHYRK